MGTLSLYSSSLWLKWHSFLSVLLYFSKIKLDNMDIANYFMLEAMSTFFQMSTFWLLLIFLKHK